MSTKRLERAKQLGYLVRLSGSSMTLANAYFEWCASRGLPCVRVDMRTRYASIEVDWIGVHQGWQGPRETDGWPTMPSEEMCDAAARCVHKYALAKGFNWHRDAFGAYSAGKGYWLIRRVPTEDVAALVEQWVDICGTAARDSHEQ